MELLINGEQHTFAEPMTVAALIAHLQLAGRRVAVERNRDIVPRARYDKIVLTDGDQLEIVSLVGGG